MVATKVGVHWQDEHAESLLTAEYIRDDIERSLRRLRVDTIDLLQVHWPCQSNTPLEETCEALAEAQRTGKVRYIGLCNYNAPTLQRAASLCDVSTLQTPTAPCDVSLIPSSSASADGAWGCRGHRGAGL